MTLMLVLVAAACGSAGGVETTRAPVRPKASVARIALVQTSTGIAAVTGGTDHHLWSAVGAVAAPDGSAVFAMDVDGLLVELDPHTGEFLHSWPVPLGVAPVVVAPDGAIVALSDRPTGYDSESQPRPRTRVVVVNGIDGAILHDLDLAGDVEPEAFSIDHRSLYALDYRGDHYRVQTIDLPSGERSDLIDRDKEPADDMRGRAVHGVLSSDRLQLATLYVNPENRVEPAFVHVLDLNGSSYCVHLPDAFAQGPARSQSIERTEDDHVVVRNPALDRSARFSLTAISAGETVPVTTEPSVGTAPDGPYRSVEGFQALVAVLPPA
ncbi:MAG: hypothetical protein ABIP21_01490 [Acidimicrobiia bacterium]